MPKRFMACVKSGRVRTIPVGKGVGKGGHIKKHKIHKGQAYMRICYPQGGGGPVHGEVRHKKGN
jgi:hypothetical protein